VLLARFMSRDERTVTAPLEAAGVDDGTACPPG
jgi:hypothetical protein